jgi:hypothetical protein
MRIHPGHSVASVQHRLSHRKPDTTLRIYTHQWNYRDAQRSTIGEQLGNLLSPEEHTQRLHELGG